MKKIPEELTYNQLYNLVRRLRKESTLWFGYGMILGSIITYTLILLAKNN